MQRALRDKLERRLGSPIVRADRVSGGDIHQAFRIELGDGRALFVKTSTKVYAQMFEHEAAGLAWLADAHAALRIPTVVFASSADDDGPACLVLEWLACAPRGRDFDVSFGRGLAQLHRSGA